MRIEAQRWSAGRAGNVATKGGTRVAALVAALMLAGCSTGDGSDGAPGASAVTGAGQAVVRGSQGLRKFQWWLPWWIRQ